MNNISRERGNSPDIYYNVRKYAAIAVGGRCSRTLGWPLAVRCRSCLPASLTILLYDPPLSDTRPRSSALA